MTVPSTRPLLIIEVAMGGRLEKASVGIKITPIPIKSEMLTFTSAFSTFSLLKISRSPKMISPEKTGKIAAYPTAVGREAKKEIAPGKKLMSKISKDAKTKGSFSVILLAAINPLAPAIGTGPIAPKIPPSIWLTPIIKPDFFIDGLSGVFPSIVNTFSVTLILASIFVIKRSVTKKTVGIIPQSILGEPNVNRLGRVNSFSGKCRGSV